MSDSLLDPVPTIVAPGQEKTLTTKMVVEIAKGLEGDRGGITPPTASREEDDPSPCWNPDPADDLLPSTKGFVTDCVYYHRGREVPKLYTLWSSLFAIASAVKRQAWIEWADGKLFTNLYLLIVGRAGVTHKGTATNLAVDLLHFLDREILDITGDPNIAGMKRINPFTGSATNEALVTAMKPENQRGKAFEFKNVDGSTQRYANGDPIIWFPTSEISIVQGEMSTFMNRSNFMETLVPTLLNLYDAQDDWANNTGVRGTEGLRSVLINLLGNTTPNALKETLPAGATADGFLSRCLIVYQPFSHHEFFPPVVPPFAPTKPELRQRLAWIAATTFGEWKLSEDALKIAQKWYSHHKAELFMSGMFEGIKSRLDTIMLRVAALIRWQRYERDDNLIHVQDVEDAVFLLNRTFEEAIPVYRMIMETKSSDKWLKIEEIIRRYGKVARQKLIQEARVPTLDVRACVDNLVEQGMVEIQRGGKKVPNTSTDRSEIYIWTGEEVKTRRPVARVLRPTVTELQVNGTKHPTTPAAFNMKEV